MKKKNTKSSRTYKHHIEAQKAALIHVQLLLDFACWVEETAPKTDHDKNLYAINKKAQMEINTHAQKKKPEEKQSEGKS